MLIASVSPGEVVLIPVFVMAAAILGPCFFGIKFAERKRTYQHTERMKALDMGLVPPGDSAWPAAVCISIGAGVPIVSFVVAMIVTLVMQRGLNSDSGSDGWMQSNHFEELIGIIWGCTTAVSICAIAGGVALAFRLLGGRRRPLPANGYDASYAAKPAFDPDAYDTVSRRG